MRFCVAALAFLVACESGEARVSEKIDRVLADRSLGERERVLAAAEIGWPATVCNRNVRLQSAAGRRRLLVECFRNETPAVQRTGANFTITVYRELGRQGPEETAEHHLFRLLGRGLDEVVVVDRWKVFVEGRLVTLIDHPRLTHAVDAFSLQSKLLDAADVSELAPYDLVMDERRAILPATGPGQAL